MTPDLHRPMTPGDYATPVPVVADDPGTEAEMLVTINKFDALAELAGMDPEQLARIKEQEWGPRKSVYIARSCQAGMHQDCCNVRCKCTCGHVRLADHPSTTVRPL